MAVDVMKKDPAAPRVETCPGCGAEVLRVTLPAGRGLYVSRHEVTADEAEAGLYVGVDHGGHARPLRLPSDALHRGEAIHAPHELVCQRYAEVAHDA